MFCRSKIVYVHHQANWCNQQARKEYSELENTVREFHKIKRSIKNNLEKLQQWLIDVPEVSFEYARYLRDLQVHKTSIRTNTKNYRLHFDAVDRLCEQNDLEFLFSFSKLAQSVYIEQINIDLAYLTPANDFFKQMIETIRGIVELEEAKREQSLEITVQRLAFALGGGAIISGVVAEHIKEPFIWIPNFKYPLHPITNSLIWSILATLLLYFIAWWWTNLKRKR